MAMSKLRMNCGMHPAIHGFRENAAVGRPTVSLTEVKTKKQGE